VVRPQHRRKNFRWYGRNTGGEISGGTAGKISGGTTATQEEI